MKLDEERQILEEKRQQQIDHEAWQQEKIAKMRKELEAIEQAKRDKQMIAVDKAKKLDELKEKWISVSASNNNTKDKANVKKKRPRSNDDDGKVADERQKYDLDSDYNGKDRDKGYEDLFGADEQEADESMRIDTDRADSSDDEQNDFNPTGGGRLVKKHRSTEESDDEI
jgi:hypothetical protein